MEFLLSDETKISNCDYAIRKNLYEHFMSLPKDFFSKMRHLQPQIGCFNNCSFCSKFSCCKSEFWNEKTLRNVVSAIKYSAMNYTNGDLLLAWERTEHRVGVTFPYLNNDIGNYYYLDRFVEICYKELGVRTRLSTVGFSRYNKKLNKVHKKICNSDLLSMLAGVRLSLTQYGRAWEDEKSGSSLKEYQKDITNFLKIYKPYYKTFGSGFRKMCVEIRYNPLVVNKNVYVINYNNHMVIATGNYLFVSKNKNVNLCVAHITDPYLHSLQINEKAKLFNEYILKDDIKSAKQLEKYLSENINNLDIKRECEIYLFENRDGKYYSINPKLTDYGNYGINIYPKTEKRKKSGYLVTERFFLNALYEFKNMQNLKLRDKYSDSSWNDVEKVYKICENIAFNYKEEYKIDKYEYILEHVLPIIRLYINALRKAGYPSDAFFDSKFTIDTGTICNLGRAINLFKGITSFINEPLTPTHERNYGRICSTMKQENYVWRLSCNFNDKIEIEKLNLFNTASEGGQQSFKETISVPNANEKIAEEKEKYLYPGVEK